MSEWERERGERNMGERERERAREGTNILCSILIIEYVKHFITKGIPHSDIDI